jgi:hypothetical protein
MSNTKQTTTIYQVVTGIAYEGLCVSKEWKAFRTLEAAKEYADILSINEGVGATIDMYYDYVRIIQTELE